MCPAEYAPADREKRPDSGHRTQPVVVAPRPRSTAPPLVVGAAHDRAEREADRVADEVIARLQGDLEHEVAERTAAPAVHRSTAPPGSDAEVEVGRDGGPLSEQLSSRIDRRRGGGTALPAPVRERMEAGFGRSLSGVRIHHDAEAARLNRSVAARAFTTGNDIFFGAGEYRPDTPAGERVLAHELAHTQQQGSGARRTTIRRWDLGGTLDWAGQTKKVATIPSGQAVFFLDDTQGERIAVKAEDNRGVGLNEMSSVIHESLSGVKSVHHRKLTGQDRAAILALIGDRAKLDAASWQKLGADVRAKHQWVLQDLGDGDHDDVEVAQYFHQQQLGTVQAMMAMTYASGQTAQAASRGADTDPMKLNPEQSRMRALLTDFKHLENLGQMTAVDLFLGNSDRVMLGNVGNWIYDPYSAAITAIDHVDSGVADAFDPNNKSQTDLSDLAKSALGATAAKAVRGLAAGVSDPKKGNDPTFTQWLDSEGGYRRQMMEEGLQNGLERGRKLLIKTFSATRFNLRNRKARAVKKSIKQAAKAAQGVDQATNDPEYYYKLLKQRAAWIKKH